MRAPGPALRIDTDWSQAVATKKQAGKMGALKKKGLGPKTAAKIAGVKKKK